MKKQYKLICLALIVVMVLTLGVARYGLSVIDKKPIPPISSIYENTEPRELFGVSEERLLAEWPEPDVIETDQTAYRWVLDDKSFVLRLRFVFGRCVEVGRIVG